MTDVEETKRLKAKNLRFKKPICRDLNLDTIKENLYDIMCECEDIRWYTDSDDGEDTWADDEAKKKLKQMTKDELILAVRQCFKIYQSYMGLQNRYDSLKAAIDILKDKNTGILQVIREIEKLYEATNEKQGFYAEYSDEWKEFDRYANALPPEAWIQ